MRIGRLLGALSSCAIAFSLVLAVSKEAKSEETKSERSPLTSPQVIAQATSTILQQQGVLERGDSVISSDNSLYDSYTFRGRAGQQVTITLDSSEFDTYLILLDSSGTVMGQNDDFSPNNTNSSLTVTLPANDTYTIFANSYDNSGRGRYALTVLSVGAAPAASVGQSTTPRIMARPMAQTAQSCQSALTSVRDRLQRVRGLQSISTDRRDISQDYADYPSGRPDEYLFVMDGPATDSVLSSPVLLEDMSNNIFQGCSSVGMVSFALANSGYVVTFGWSPNGPLEFDCLEPEVGSPDPRWGQRYCT